VLLQFQDYSLKVVAALKLIFICKTIFDITKLYMSCFSGCELHLIKDIIVCYFTKYPQISVICNNKKNYLLINGEISSEFNTDWKCTGAMFISEIHFTYFP